MSAIDILRNALFGNPPSTTFKPSREGVLAAFTEMNNDIGSIALASAITVFKTTRANLDADLVHAVNTIALVYDDATDANNDIYIKVGASGAGSWTLTDTLHAIIDGLADPYVVAAEAAAALAAAYGFQLVPLGPIGSVVEQDPMGRVSRALLADGGQFITKLYRPGPGGLVDRREVWAELDAIGGTALQRAVIPAMNEGFMPRFSPVSTGTPALTLYDVATGTTPTGYAASGPYWNDPAIRREGGVWHNDGANGWSAVSTYQAGTYVNDDMSSSGGKGCNGARFEFDYDGDELLIGMVGGGAPFKMIVDGAYIQENDSKFFDFTFFPPDGQYRRFKLTLGAAGPHRIMMEAFGGIRLNDLRGKTGTTFSYPTTLDRPRVYFDGTSVVESGAGWYRATCRILNVDGWNAGVGASGLFNPGTTGRDNMWNRKNWRHGQFAYGIHQGLINDSLANAGGDGTYNDGFKRYVDQYRRILDDWGTYQNGRPWFALGYYPNEGFPDEFYCMRDAMEQACAEFNQFACLIEPLPHGGTFPSGSVPQSYYLNIAGGDPTHPDWRGSPALGRRISRQIGDLIRGGRF